MAKAKSDKALKDRQIKNLERALKEERMGITAMALAFIKAHGDPELILRRIEAMVRNADEAGAKPRTKQVLIAGQHMVERALAIEMGKPQPLFTDEPDVGHVPPGQAKELAEGASKPEQIGLDFSGNGGTVGDVRTAEEDKAKTTERVKDAILALLVDHGAMTDGELYVRYAKRTDFLTQSAGSLRARRTELVRAGRLVKNGDKREGDKDVPVWDLYERAA